MGGGGSKVFVVGYGLLGGISGGIRSQKVVYLNLPAPGSRW